MKMNNESKVANLHARKQALKQKLVDDRELIRQDLKDLKEDINPFKQVGKFVKNLLHPSVESGEADLLETGLDTAVTIAVGSLVPNPKLAVIAPVLVKKAIRKVIPPVKMRLVKTLRWIAEKTKDPVAEQPTEILD